MGLAAGESDTIGIVKAETDMADYAAEFHFGRRSALSVCQARIQQLEQQCAAFHAENLRLRVAEEESNLAAKRARELNFRLGREAQEARRQLAHTERRAAAHEGAVTALRDELRTVRRASKAAARRHAEGAISVKAEVAEVAASAKVAVCCSNHDSACVDLQSVGPAADKVQVEAVDTVESCNAAADEVLSALQEAEEELCLPPGLPVCSCNSPGSWGCSLHASYSTKLLLAHRDISMSVAGGAPGLIRDPS